MRSGVAGTPGQVVENDVRLVGATAGEKEFGQRERRFGDFGLSGDRGSQGTLSRVVKILALIDFLWLFLLANTQPFLLAGAVLALAGCYGAHSYNKFMIALFSLYLVGSIAVRIYIMAVVGTAQLYVLLALSSLIDLYLLRVVGIFYRLCARLSPSEKAELQMLNRPNFQMN